MDNIRRPSESGSGVPDTTAFIHCINGREPQTNKFWCQDLEGIFREVHPTVRVDILDGTVKYFVTEYLAGNGCRIRIIGEISVNGSIHFLGLSDQVWGSGLLYITNLQAQVEATWWGISNNSNQIWGGRFNNSNSITNVAWGTSVDACPAYLPRSPVSPRVAQRRVCDNLIYRRRQECWWSQSNRRNP